ncbi:MAG: cysteine synthase B [Flavobacteriaceae bacterium]|nr:MAG: cysteine synthase B [Flavobacteriaceae bacterium]
MNITQLIGNTPLVELKNLNKNPKVRVFAKLEGQNPGGSVKDRPAFQMIQGALDRKEIQKGDKLVEATSGNTGIALAMIAKALGLHLTLIMPDDATEERVKTMRAYGAELILTPVAKTIEYSRELAQEMQEEQGYFQLNQFANPDNYMAHYKTTGPEIWRDTEKEITHFVSAMGTTGTIMGVSNYLKEQNKNVTIVGAQPTDGSKIPGIRRWSKEFLPKIYDASKVDIIKDVSQKQAEEMARKLALEEAIMGGTSSGGAAHIALELAGELSSGCIVFIVCDRGDRYLSTDLYQ